MIFLELPIIQAGSPKRTVMHRLVVRTSEGVAYHHLADLAATAVALLA